MSVGNHKDTMLTDNQRTMLDAMIERQLERYVGWDTRIVSEFPPLTDFNTLVHVGTFGWTIPALKTRLIKRGHAYDIGAGWVTAGDIARDYVSIKYSKRRKRITTSQYNACVKGRVASPIYCEPTTLEYGYYVDISAAYWNIVQVVGWDVNYLPSRFLCVQSDNSDFPCPQIKMARNCLVSIGLSGIITNWTGTELVHLRKPNPFVNYLLYRLVMDVLNGVAYEAVSVGAVYAFTDGFICSDKNLRAVCKAIRSWGLPYSIKREGEVKVLAPACYSFPDFKTRVKFPDVGRRRNSIAKVDIDWLKWRFLKFAERRIDQSQTVPDNPFYN